MICALTSCVTQARLKPIGFNRYGRYYNDNNTCSVHLYMHNIIPIIADNIRCQWCNAYIPLHEYKYKLYALQYLFCGSMRERTSCWSHDIICDRIHEEFGGDHNNFIVTNFDMKRIVPLLLCIINNYCESINSVEITNSRAYLPLMNARVTTSTSLIAILC